MTTPPDATAAIRIREKPTTRTARYAMAGAPPGEAARIWFVLHGYGQLAPRFLRPFAGAIPADTCVIAPEGLSRFYLEMPRVDGSHMQRIGAAWLTRESRETEIADALAWLNGVHDDVVDESRQARNVTPVTAVLGFSQGVATAMRWVAAGRVTPQCFVAWAGGLALDVSHEMFRAKVVDGDVVLVAGEHDPFVTLTARSAVREQFGSYHVSPRELTFDGAHQLHTETLAQLLSELPRPR